MIKKITKLHEYAIYYLFNTLKMDTKTIAKEVGLTHKQIDKFLNIQKKPASIPTATSSTESIDDSLLINKTQGNRGGVSIMTGAASAKADELNKQNNSPIVSRTAKNAIFRPKNK
jgi:hypothetical protein